MNTATIKNHTILEEKEDFIQVWIESFLFAKRDKSKNTQRFYQQNLEMFTRYCNDHSMKTIQQLTPQFLREFFAYLETKGLNLGGRWVYFRSIRAFLYWYQEELDLDDWKNPIKKVKLESNPVEPLDGVTKEQVQLLLKHCERNTFEGERDKLVILVLYDTGVRSQELCDIRVENVNVPMRSIFIAHGKGDKARMVFFGDSTAKQIRKFVRLSRNDEWLLHTRDGQKLIYSSLRQIIRRLCEKAGVPEIPRHSFRRGFTLECLRKGLPETTIARLLGHSSTALIPRYAKQTTIDLMNGYKSPMDE